MAGLIFDHFDNPAVRLEADRWLCAPRLPMGLPFRCFLLLQKRKKPIYNRISR